MPQSANKILINDRRMMKPGLYAFIFLFLPAVFFSEKIYCQGYNEEVDIIAPYQPRISDVTKIPVKPAARDTLNVAGEQEYNIISLPFASNYKTAPLNPVFFEVEPDLVLRRNYLRAGFGNYTTPYAELFSNSLKSSDYSLGFRARHLSSSGKIDNYATSSFSQNLLSLNGARYLKNKYIYGDIEYKRDVVHYYGFKPGDFPEVTIADDHLKQRFSNISAAAGIRSSYRKDDEVNYNGSVHFYNLADQYNTRETNVGIEAKVDTRKKELVFSDKQKLGIDFRTDIWNNRDSLQEQGNLIVDLEPYVRFDFDYLDLSIGILATLAADSSSSFHAYPVVSAMYEVIPDYLRFNIGITGGISRNSYLSVTSVNPWADPLFPQGFTNTRYKISGGISGNLLKMIDYNFTVTYAEEDDRMFFITDFLHAYSPEIDVNLANKFTGITDDVKITTVKVEVSYPRTERLGLYFDATYNNFRMEHEKQPWHEPAFTSRLKASYHLTTRISLTGDLFFRSKLYAKVIEGGTESTAIIKGFADLSLGGEYRFTDRISAFVQLNNLMASRYYLWYNYPSQRLNAMAGVTFSF